MPSPYSLQHFVGPLIPQSAVGYKWARPGPYVTKLSPEDETKYQQWVKETKAAVTEKEEDSDYDMRGFWQGLHAGDPRAKQGVSDFDGRMHYKDTWKMPNHPTFSRESMYALPEAPQWDADDQLIDMYHNVLANEGKKPNKR